MSSRSKMNAQGTLGLIIALWMYCRKTKMHYMDVLDMIAVATPVTACCIRLANLMNSEIIGKPADVPWAFVDFPVVVLAVYYYVGKSDTYHP